MRRVLALTLALALAIAGMTMFSSAQAQTSLGSVAGRAVNAAGRALPGQRVDLMRGAQVVNVATTNTQGDWAFQNVVAGDYVVRTSINGRIAGTRVSVAAGQSVTGTMIVAPTAAVSPQFGALAGLVGNLTTGIGAAAASAATAAGIDTTEVSLNAEQVAAIFNALPADQKVEFAQAVTQALQNSGNLTGSGSGSGGGSSNAFIPVQNAQTASSSNTQSNPAQNALLVSALVTIAENPGVIQEGVGSVSIVIPTATQAPAALTSLQNGDIGSSPIRQQGPPVGGFPVPPVPIPLTTIVSAS
ncbi:MAG: carboxypeptidase-like regulatory domain-containing protein [Vicinamibacterales bacterium]